MKPFNLNDEWESFASMIFNGTESDIQRREMRLSFFAGIAVMHGFYTKEMPDYSEKAALQVIDEIEKQIINIPEAIKNEDNG